MVGELCFWQSTKDSDRPLTLLLFDWLLFLESTLNNWTNYMYKWEVMIFRLKDSSFFPDVDSSFFQSLWEMYFFKRFPKCLFFGTKCHHSHSLCEGTPRSGTLSTYRPMVTICLNPCSPSSSPSLVLLVDL